MELLEREPYLAELQSLVQQTASGSGSLALLGGEAGVGKTSLVQTLGQLITGSARVLTGACDALSTPRPLGPIEDVVAGANGNLDSVLHGNTRRDAIFRAVLGELC